MFSQNATALSFFAFALLFLAGYVKATTAHGIFLKSKFIWAISPCQRVLSSRESA